MRNICILLLITLSSTAVSAQTAVDFSSEPVMKIFFESTILSGKYDPFEGIWEGKEEMQLYVDKKLLPVNPIQSKIAIFKSDAEFLIIEIDKGKSDLQIVKDSRYGEFTAKREHYFEGTAKFSDSNNLRIVMKATKAGKLLLTGTKFIEMIDDIEIYTEIILQKSYPLDYDIERIKTKAVEEAPKSGTGFALSSNGFIATNYHVIENAKSIKVRGVKGNFTTMLNATIIKSDQSADLAIIKIDDPNFADLGKIPYSIVNSNTDVGEEVFALGYPLTNTMGEEVKLTTGIISASSGYQGNQNQYQISVPVQPGNSGGPLFDKNGKVVGIINAKHTNTDNVSYAIKARNLLGLFYMISDAAALDTNFMIGKTLPEKVRQVKNFIYIIEVNK